MFYVRYLWNWWGRDRGMVFFNAANFVSGRQAKEIVGFGYSDSAVAPDLHRTGHGGPHPALGQDIRCSLSEGYEPKSSRQSVPVMPSASPNSRQSGNLPSTPIWRRCLSVRDHPRPWFNHLMPRPAACSSAPRCDALKS